MLQKTPLSGDICREPLERDRGQHDGGEKIARGRKRFRRCESRDFCANAMSRSARLFLIFFARRL